MKKIITLFFVCFCLLFLQHSNSLSIFASEFFGTHTFFSFENFENENCTTTKNGNGFLICCSTQNANKIFSNLDKSKICGESVCFENQNFNLKKLLHTFQAKVVKTESTENIYIVYAFSPKFFDYVLIDGKKVNLQIAQSKQKITIGTPLILGSF